jgi:hypothetical protein
MKRGISILIAFIVFTWECLPVLARDTDPRVEKRKTYTKTYPLSGSDKVTLDNQFGELKINTWEKNEIKVDVTIIGRASTDEVAQKILDQISIEDGKGGGGVYFRTKFKNKNGNWNKGDKGDKKEYKEQGMEINYSVYMPAGNPLDASNQFGAMIVPDYRGPVELSSKFGSLTAGKLTNVKDVLIEFGEANIESINNGKLTVKFSSGTNVKKLNGDVDTRVEFSDKVKLVLDNNMKDLDVRSSYSTLFLDVANNFSANFDIRTSFGELDNKSSFSIKEEKEDDHDKHGPRFDKQYNGMSGSGSSKVKVKSDFGEVVIGHNLNVDFSEKKSKKKGKVI